MARAYVILLHSGHGQDHCDLMLEACETLATWRLPAGPPDLAPGDSLRAIRLADHRRAYLTHEGPVGGGRGTVRRVDSGTCEVVERKDDRWLIDFAGTKLAGRYELRHTGPGDEDWTFGRMA